MQEWSVFELSDATYSHALVYAQCCPLGSPNVLQQRKVYKKEGEGLTKAVSGRNSWCAFFLL